MPAFTRLIRFQTEDGKEYFADIGTGSSLPSAGDTLSAFTSLQKLQSRADGSDLKFGKLLSPITHENVAPYCAGLNYKSHAAEFGMDPPKSIPLWTKPVTVLTHPECDIPMNKFCASNYPDYEGELVFITSKTCRDISEEQAPDYILGYTVGNDLTCRKFQETGECGGQAFFAKHFDNFAPIGPALINAELYGEGEGFTLTTRVNGELLQEADLGKDMIFMPHQILSFMSQGTTIPAGTAVMTGSPAGIGFFRKPMRVLKHDDIVEVEITHIGVLRNRIVFEA